MKILVTGADGQLGSDLLRMLEGKHEVDGLTIDELDFEFPEKVYQEILERKADWVINCAAYTQVDLAEDNEKLARLINADSPGMIAKAVAEYGGKLAHISTDFIFDGQSSAPYMEDAKANPLGVYGKTKYEGEQSVQQYQPDALIIRTAWVYGVNGHNFVKTIIRLCNERDQLTVVDDQVGSPTWSMDLAVAVLDLVEQGCGGIFHYTNEGVASWYDFSQAILQEGRLLGLIDNDCTISPVPTSQYPTKAVRPPYSVLNKEKTRAKSGFAIPYWRDSLRLMMERLVSE